MLIRGFDTGIEEGSLRSLDGNISQDNEDEDEDVRLKEENWILDTAQR